MSLGLQGTPANCQDGFVPAFGGDNKIAGRVFDYALFDPGSGLALYAGGAFQAVNGQFAPGLAKRVGSQWTPEQLPLGNSINPAVGGVRALETWDDGTGTSLYLGGSLRIDPQAVNEGLFEWDGAGIQPVGGGLASAVTDLVVWNDGAGDALYVVGSFNTPPGSAMENIARWDGAQFSSLGAGPGGSTTALTVFDDGSRSSLIAAVSPPSTGGPPPFPQLMRWDGTVWQTLSGNPVQVPGPMAVHDDGSGPALFVSARVNIGPTRFAKWDGTSWQAISGTNAASIEEMITITTAGGEELFARGQFSAVGGLFDLRRWNGTLWESLPGSPVEEVESMFERPSAIPGQTVLEFSGAAVFDGETVGMFSYDGNQWSGARATGLDDRVGVIHKHTKNGAETLILGGQFTHIGGAPLAHLVEWDGQSFTQIASGFTSNQTVLGGFGWVFRACATFDDGTGDALYVGGYFTGIDGVATNGIAKWDGTTWTALDGGVGDGNQLGVEELIVYNDGNGPALYVGGRFSGPGGTSAAGLARWDGTSWSAVGNLSTVLGERSRILSIAEFDDGTGNALYAGGWLFDSSGAPQRGLLRFDGATWTPVTGPGLVQCTQAQAMAVYGDGSDRGLFILGAFDNDPTAQNVTKRPARWDGQAWELMEQDVVGEFYDAMVYDDGNGPKLYAAGNSRATASAEAGAPVIVFDGFSWQAISSELPPQLGTAARGIEAFDSGSGPELWIASGLPASALGDSYLSRYRICSPGDEFCFADDSPLPGCEACPCGNSLSSDLRGGCSNSVGTGARLAVSGTNDIAAGDLRFELEAAVPNSVALLVSGGAALPGQGPCPSGNGVQSFLFDGFRCVGMGTLRHGTRAIDSNGQSGVTNSGWGPPNGPTAGLPAQANAVAGQSRYFQVFYRDDVAASCGRGLNTSNGVRVLFR